MSGKGSRQRTYGKAFEDNFDRIFRKGSQSSSEARDSFEDCVEQFPREAREEAQRAAQELSGGDS